jgi:hypothetical protein
MNDGTIHSRALALVVGLAAIIAPVLHSASDLLEWRQGGFSPLQLWLNYVAFLPMAWLLFGIWCAHPRRPGWMGLLGALLYGAAFTYFAHTTLYALGEDVVDYETLWSRLGGFYTLNGALMVVGGMLFAWDVRRAGWLPSSAVWLLLAGLAINLVLALLPAPDILQIAGSGLRNLGIVLMGVAILHDERKGQV